MNPYLKEYEWSNIKAMLKNNKAFPKTTDVDFKGRLVVITGSTSGIGLETARLYASHGADLLCINRNKEKSEALQRGIQQEFGVACDFWTADFSSLEEVRAVGRHLQSLERGIDVLIHNAGVYNTKRRFTQNGMEEVFQVNYLSSFIINHMVAEKLRSQKEARILLVNSEGHRFALSGFLPDDLRWESHAYTGLRGYGSAKTAQLLSLFPFVELFKGSGVTINAMHPGDVRSNMGENNGRVYKFFKHLLINPSARDPVISAQALYYLGASPDVKDISGRFFNLTTLETPAPHALDRAMAARLWDLSLSMGGMS